MENVNIDNDKELRCPVELNCPNAPCYKCRRNTSCCSFADYRSRHPEYDEKITLYVTTHRAQLKQVELELEQRAKQRSLCEAGDREQVSQQGRRPKDRVLVSSSRIRIKSKQNLLWKRSTPTMRLDFTDVKELEYKQAAEGQGDFEIIGAKQTKSKNGQAMLVIDAKDAEGGFVRDNVMLEGPGAFKAKQLIKALGITEDDFIAMDASDLIGLTFTAEIVIQEYEGKEYSKIKKYIG